MISPMPVDELPSFIAKSNEIGQPGNNPWLKYIIVGGILLLGVVFSAAIIGKKQQNSKPTKTEENENGND